jgi:hypothetical protein
VSNTVEAETLNPSLTLTLVKKWEDGEDRDRIRPDSVNMTLLMNQDTEVATISLDAENGWTTMIADLPKRYNGVRATYSWREEPVEGYTAEMEVVGNTTTFTNTYRPAMTTLTVYKEWRDANDPNARPLSITVYLTGSDGSSYSQVLSANDNWQWTVSVPMYHNGKLITYTWAESTVRGYRGTQTTTGNVTVFVNTRTGGGVVPPTPPTPETIDEPGTPLGLGQVYINVGD